ncbi:amidohydrolase family protein [Geosporobacter ferrireducens]|uniref:Amidohydrolase n=1 Tax=Geosporobacter ferrireducens TaxID=1424294 RepID=A0A1D8GIN5_9FIRM|nr:amidohydrolase family protein [Geosporobacter ferrireducens]AOT70758.1 amidohydrolase [Geosporobacter ferrireducens]MTI57246.1 amidohydrolase family protein [Geosporobacter ferrireducens]
MKNVDMIVKAPHFYTMEGDGVGYRTEVAMVVDGGKIIEIAETGRILANYKGAEELDMDHHAIFPGFIDAHMHTACNIMRGLAQDTNHWMMYGLQPFDNAISDEERDVGSYVAIIEAIKAGTTTLGDYESKMDNVCHFIEKVGARGNITQTIRAAKRRVYQPGELYEFDDELGTESLTRNLALYDRWHNKAGGRIKILFGPQGADFVSPEMLLKIQKIVKERKTKIHMHTQQGDRETYQIVNRYGKRPVAFLESLGYLDESLMAVHLTDCSDEEAAVVAKSGASMILCPGSIAIIDGIVPPSVAFQEAGGNVALGSDQAPGNNCHNIINEMKNVALFNKIKYGNPEVMPAWRALRMATIEGARAVGLGDRVGSLEVGKQADFIAIDLSCPSMLPIFTYPMRNMVPNLVYSARGQEVSLVAVDGMVIMRDGKILTIEEEDYLKTVSRYPAGIGQRAAKEFFEINGTNAQFMAEGKL